MQVKLFKLCSWCGTLPAIYRVFEVWKNQYGETVPAFLCVDCYEEYKVHKEKEKR